MSQTQKLTKLFYVEIYYKFRHYHHHGHEGRGYPTFLCTTRKLNPTILQYQLKFYKFTDTEMPASKP